MASMALVPAAAAIGSAVSSALSLAKSSKRRRRTTPRVVATMVPVVSRKTKKTGMRAMRAPKRRVNRAGYGINMSHPVPVTAPSAVSAVNGGSNFRLMASTGREGDRPNADGIAIQSSLELAYGVRTGTDYAEDAKNGGLAHSGGTALTFVEARPADLGTTQNKLANLAPIFAYYRFRRMRIRYIPQQASTNTAMIYLVFIPDPDQTGITIATTGFTPALFREYKCSLVTPSWQPAEFTMDYGGTEYWSNDGGDIADFRAQGLIGAVVRGGAAGVVYGRIEIDYLVDLNGPRSTIASPAIIKPQQDVKSSTSDKDLKTRYVSVDNDDVKSLFEESVAEKPLLKRSEPVPIPRPPSKGGTQDPPRKLPA